MLSNFDEINKCKVASIANNVDLNFDAKGNSLMYYRKSKRPRTEPCGIATSQNHN